MEARGISQGITKDHGRVRLEVACSPPRWDVAVGGSASVQEIDSPELGALEDRESVIRFPRPAIRVRT